MKNIVLAGAGYVNLEILKSLQSRDLAQNRYTLISPDTIEWYSGLIPSFLRGDSLATQLQLPVADFARAKGAIFLPLRIQSINGNSKSLQLSDGTALPYDLLFLNIGGSSTEIPSEFPEKTVYLKPLSRFFRHWAEIEQFCARTNRPPAFALIGGGAASIEIAAALKIKLARQDWPQATVQIFTEGDRLTPRLPLLASAVLHRELQKLGVQVHFGRKIDKIDKQFLTPNSGARAIFDYVLVSTPVTPSALHLPFVNNSSDTPEVDDFLELAPSVFAAGDFASLKSEPQLPKSGAIAVHQGRYLAKALKCRLANKPVKKFSPPTHQLNILSLNSSLAMAAWGQFFWTSVLSQRWKDFIDEDFVKSFKGSAQAEN